MTPEAVLAAIPSPSQGVWYLGPIPVRAYALLIIAGILVAVWLGSRRYVARGGDHGVIGDIAIWAVPFGIVGGRLYHVVTDWQLYFGPNGAGPVAALRIWDGGLGIWGAVALGALGAWIGARRAGLVLPPIADAIAPGIALAQAIGRWGNYFNQELFGAPTTLPWGLEIDPAHLPVDPATGLPYPAGTLFQPTFLYECLWLAVVAAGVMWADRRFRMGHGRVFALYVALYCAGRLWIETLRIDPANTILGLRLNVWTSLLVGLGAIAYLVLSSRRRPGRETVEELRRTSVAPAEDAPAEDAAAGDGDPGAAIDAHDDDTDPDATEEHAAPGEGPAPA